MNESLWDSEAVDAMRKAVELVDAIADQDADKIAKILTGLDQPVGLIIALGKLVLSQNIAMGNYMQADPKVLWKEMAEGVMEMMEQEQMLLATAEAMEKLVDGGA